MSKNKKQPKKPRFKPDRSKPDADRETIEVSLLRSRKATFVVTKNLLHNLIVRDAVAINESFDLHYGSKLNDIDRLFSEAAFLFFVATREDTGLHENYKLVLTGLVNSALNTFGAAVTLLRNGMMDQSMVLIRQIIEICATIIHIGSDPKGQAIKDFEEGKYASTTSIGQAKKAVPIIGHFWGFLSTTYVHINRLHSEIQSVRPYEADNADVEAVLACLRMSAWVCYIAAEFAFPTAIESNRYWKRQSFEGRSAVAYDPDEDERNWAANFLSLEDVSPDDLGDEGDADPDGDNARKGMDI